jgi:hypothetical protein
MHDPHCPVRMWSPEQVVAIHDALEELLDCVRRAHPKVLEEHERWDDIAQDGAEMPADNDDLW